MIFLGIRLYMEETSEETVSTRSTALVVLNTRSISGYKSVDEMLQNQEAKSLWGNQCLFLHIPLPELHQNSNPLNPLKFVEETQNVVKRMRNSFAVYLNGMLLESIRKFRGLEVCLHHALALKHTHIFLCI